MNHASPSSMADVRKSRRRLAGACIDLGVWMLIAWLLGACTGVPAPAGPTGATAPAPVTLTVSAAADLTYAFSEIGKQFEAETGHKVVFNFGSTGQLARQFKQGAPVDLFAAANVSFVDDLARQGLILPDTKQLYARGRITLWTRADSPLQITRLEDLTRPEIVRIAIANPDHAPCGSPRPAGDAGGGDLGGCPAQARVWR